MLLIDIFRSPASVFANIEEKENSIKHLFISALILIIAFAFLYPVNNRLNEKSFATMSIDMSPEQIRNSQAVNRVSNYFAVLLIPVRQMIIVSIVALFLYLLLIVFTGKKSDYRKLLALGATASIILALDTLGGNIVNLCRIGQIQNTIDIQSSFLGARSFIAINEHPFLRVLSDSFSPLWIWYWCFLVTGVHVLVKISKLRSFIIIIPMWICQAAIQIIVQTMTISLSSGV